MYLNSSFQSLGKWFTYTINKAVQISYLISQKKIIFANHAFFWKEKDTKEGN